MTDPITWGPVREFLYRALGGRTTTIIAGTEEWCALADDDPRKTTALLIAGSRWCLEQELQHLDDQRRAFKDAALAVAESKDWKTVAQRIRSRDSYYREHPDLKRKKVS